MSLVSTMDNLRFQFSFSAFPQGFFHVRCSPGSPNVLQLLDLIQEQSSNPPTCRAHLSKHQEPLGRFGIPSIIIYLLLKVYSKQPPLLINQPMGKGHLWWRSYDIIQRHGIFQQDSRNMEGIPSRLQDERPNNFFNSKPGRPRLQSRTDNLSMLIYHHLPMRCMLHILKQLRPVRPSPWTWGFTARNHKYQCLAWSSRCRDTIALLCIKNHPNQTTSHHILGMSENSLYTCMYLCMYMIYIYISTYIINNAADLEWFPAFFFAMPRHVCQLSMRISGNGTQCLSCTDGMLKAQAMWFFLEMGVPPNGWFIMQNTIKIWMIWGYPYFRNPPCKLVYN